MTEDEIRCRVSAAPSLPIDVFGDQDVGKMTHDVFLESTHAHEGEQGSMRMNACMHINTRVRSIRVTCRARVLAGS